MAKVGCTEPYRNAMAKQFALHYGKAITSGSDFHSIARLGKGGIISDKRICTSSDLVSVLRSGAYTLIEDI